MPRLRALSVPVLTATFLWVSLIGYVSPAAAWGPSGHVLVARLAEKRLSPAAKAALSPLLQGRALADVASWADDWRTFHGETGRWHYVDVPLEAPAYDEARDCPKRNCVVGALASQLAKLAARDAPLRERQRALRFVVHLVADLHQPLHTTDHEDRGGNEVRAQLVLADGEFPYKSMPNANLHAVWDNDLLESSHRDQVTYLALLERLPPEATTWTKGTPVDWVNEAHRLAQDPVYARLPPPPEDPKRARELGPDYVEVCRPVAERQLQKAGLRLARLLNEALAGS